MERMRVSKIAAKRGVWTICWQEYQETTNNWDEHQLISKDEPRPELYTTLQRMATHVEDICDMREGAREKIIVSGITESWKDNNRWLTITAKMRLSKSVCPLNINTPARPEYSDDYDEIFCMGEELLKDLQGLEEEGLRYINGDRAQQSWTFRQINRRRLNRGRRHNEHEGERFYTNIGTIRKILGRREWRILR